MKNVRTPTNMPNLCTWVVVVCKGRKNALGSELFACRKKDIRGAVDREEGTWAIFGEPVGYVLERLILTKEFWFLERG